MVERRQDRVRVQLSKIENPISYAKFGNSLFLSLLASTVINIPTSRTFEYSGKTFMAVICLIQNNSMHTQHNLVSHSSPADLQPMTGVAEIICGT